MSAAARLRPRWPVAILGALLALPLLPLPVPVLFDGPINSPGNLQLLAVGFALGIAALSYNLLFGYTGILSFGHALFFGAGVYLPTIALREWGWSLALVFGFAVVAATLLAAAVGALALRTQGVYFAMVTLAFAEAGAVLVGKNVGGLTGGEEGISLPFRQLPRGLVGVVNTDNLYWLALGALLLVYLLALRLVTSPAGRVWAGIRENETRVTMLGLRPYAFKLLAFTVAGALAAAAGAVYLVLSGGATPRAVGADLTVALLLMVIIGGSGSLWGPVTGAVLYHYLNVRLTVWAGSDAVAVLPALLRLPLRDPLFVFGIIFVLLVLFFPRGLAGSFASRGWRPTRPRFSRTAAAGLASSSERER